MPTKAPSKTALKVAALRALHQTAERPPAFEDPLAACVLGAAGASLLAQHAANVDDSVQLRATLAARSLLAEGTVAVAVARGVDQYVILGAGLDTFAYRHRHASLRVFEVDRAGTQAWKRAQLDAADLSIPTSVRYVDADFERDDLFGALADAGFATSRPAVFAMLGVLFYIERDALLATFRAIASRSAKGSEFVFDYAEPFHDKPAHLRTRYGAAAARVAADGEPWVTFFEPDEMARTLQACGLVEFRDFDAAALHARFFAGRADGFTPTALGHLVHAKV